MKKWQSSYPLETGEENSVHFEVSIDDLYDHFFFTIEPEKSVIESESERLKKINLWEPILCTRAENKFMIISGHVRKRILKHRGVSKTLIRIIGKKINTFELPIHLDIMKEENLDQWERDEKITFIKKFFALEILDRVKSGFPKKGQDHRESLSKRIERASLGRIAKGTADRLLAEIRSQEERIDEENGDTEERNKIKALRSFIDSGHLLYSKNFNEEEKAIAEKNFELAEGWEEGRPLSEKIKHSLRSTAFQEMIWKEMDLSSKEDMDSLLFFRKTLEDCYRFKIIEEEVSDIQKKISELKDKLNHKKTDLVKVGLELEESFTYDRLKKIKDFAEKKPSRGRALLFGVFGALYSPKINRFIDFMEALVPEYIWDQRKKKSPKKKK